MPINVFGTRNDRSPINMTRGLLPWFLILHVVSIYFITDSKFSLLTGFWHTTNRETEEKRKATDDQTYYQGSSQPLTAGYKILRQSTHLHIKIFTAASFNVDGN